VVTVKNSLVIRQATIEDIPEIMVVEEEAWSEGLRATEEMFLSRIETFPNGTLVAEDNSRIFGVVATELVFYDLENNNPLSWYEVTDICFIRNSNNNKGDTLYGVDLSVSPYANRNISKLLLLAIGKFVIASGLKQIMFGARIPRYHKFSKRMTVEEYLRERTKSGRMLDPEIAFYTSYGLQVAKILPNYFNDLESCNTGVLLCWHNPFYGRPFKKLWSWLFKI
jgi:hypothetical protein